MVVVLQKHSLTKALPSSRTGKHFKNRLDTVFARLKQVHVPDFYNGANIGSAAASKEKPGNPHSFQSTVDSPYSRFEFKHFLIKHLDLPRNVESIHLTENC